MSLEIGSFAQEHQPPRVFDAIVPGRRILIVEDEMFVAMDIEAAVNKAGHKVVGFAGTAERAVTLAEETRPDLVLMDIYMNGIDGIALCARIKRNAMSHAIPIIMCSSSPTQDNVIKAVRAGAVDFLVKPFTRQILIEKINKHLINKNALLNSL